MSTYNSPVDVQPVTLVRSSNINDLDAAVAEAFAFLPSETLLKQGKVMYAVDTGTANTYLAALPASPVSYVDGLAFTFKASNANTGACTINVNSLGVVAISREDGTGLVTGDIVAGQMCTVRYSTTSSKFQLEGSNAASASTAAAASASAAATSASAAATSLSSVEQVGGVAKWVTGTNYADGIAVWSPTTKLSFRKNGAGISNIDPGIDAAGWVSLVPVVTGVGGTTSTGNVTLTATSPASMVVTPSGYGLYATLPNATTLTKGMSQFAIYNAGEYDYGVKDSAGTMLGWVRPQVGAVFGLADNASAPGIWNLANVDTFGVVAQYKTTTATGSIADTVVIQVDSDRTCFILSGNSCYGIVYNKTTNAWGSLTLIRAGVSNTAAILSGTNQLLVATCDATTAMQLVTLTIATLGITVNTPLPITLAGSAVQGSLELKAVSTSFVLANRRATTTEELRAITISGTTVTAGAAETPLVTNASVFRALVASGNVLRTFYTTNTDLLLYAKPYTVSGTTLTLGTGASTAAAAQQPRVRVNGNGNCVVQYTSSTNDACRVAIFKLTGTVEAVSSVATGLAAISNNLREMAVISGTKMLVMDKDNLNIITDTAGVASVGATLARSHGTSTPGIALVTANMARVYGITATSAFSTLIDCSGTSPVFSSANDKLFVVNAVSPAISNTYGGRDGRTLIAGNATYSQGTGQLLKITLNDYQITLRDSMAGTYVAGVADSESWNIFNQNPGFVLSGIKVAP